MEDFKPEYSDLVHLLEDSIAKFGDRQLFGVPKGGAWEWTTYREYGTLVDQFRGGLAQLGIGRGDRVAVISNNRLEWAVGAHATFGLAASYVPMYEAQLDKEWAYILRDCGAKVCLVADSSVQDRVERLRSEGQLPELQHVINLDDASKGAGTYAALIETGKEKPCPSVRPAPEDTACFIYTSGTTGNPKGVKLSHFNLASNVSALLSMVDIENDDRGLAFLPWAHVFGGCVELNSMIGSGSSTGICADPTKLVEYLPQVRPTVLFAVPRVWNKIYAGVRKTMASKPAAIQWIFNTGLEAKDKKRRGESLTWQQSFGLKLAERVVFPKVLEGLGGRLRFACSGAAALSREVAEFMDNLGIDVYEGYGMTETSGCTTANPLGEARLGSVGKPIPGVRVEIDTSVGGGEPGEGEIVVYGTGVMQGYHNLETATREALTEDGGMRTGDLGRFDADGYLYITGRVKELYKLENGKYVAPVPIEEKLQLSPYIAQCVVYGSNKPHNVAFIVPDMLAVREWAEKQGLTGDDDQLLTNDRIRKLIEEEVETFNKDFKGYERVKKVVIEREELTTQNGMLTPTLKLKRRNFLREYGDVLDALYPDSRPICSYIRELRPEAQPAAAAQSV